jgi:adenine phosphoribosyltransferase
MGPTAALDLKTFIRNVPDFPKKGIVFRDITTLLSHPSAFKQAIDTLATQFQSQGIQKVVGVESRGFLTAAPLAYLLAAGFVPVRKRGKLPYKTNSVSYELEYGVDTLEMHHDAVLKGERVLVADDLLATGGTAQATCELVEKSGGIVAGVAFLIELAELGGRQKLGSRPIVSLMTY